METALFIIPDVFLIPNVANSTARPTNAILPYLLCACLSSGRHVTAVLGTLQVRATGSTGLSSGRRATAVLGILQARATGPAGHPQSPTLIICSNC